MTMTKNALLLFIQSLPKGSKFEIISFGSTYECMSNSPDGYDYSDETLKTAKEKVSSFGADLGGTEIL